MRIPLSWLREYVDVTIPIAELAERLTRSGLEVDAVEHIGVPESELPWDRDLVLVCNILEVTQHPNADRLVLATVTHGLVQAGFEVIDLGINNPVEKYLGAIEEHKPDILGMSALLTTTMPYMKVVIDTLKEKGMREDYVVLVGGAPLNEEFAKAIGADAYCRDAAVAVETAKSFMARKHNQLVAS